MQRSISSANLAVDKGGQHTHAARLAAQPKRTRARRCAARACLSLYVRTLTTLSQRHTYPFALHADTRARRTHAPVTLGFES